MSSKRSANDDSNTRSLKQTKLTFGPPRSKPKDSPATHSAKPTSTAIADTNASEPAAQQPSKSRDPPEESAQRGQHTHEDASNDQEQLDGATPSREQPAQATPPPQNPLAITLTDIVGDIFAALPNSILIHACNCVGNWGAGIAAAFRKKYPAAFKTHVAYCKARKPEQLIGTAQLIPPSPGDKHQHYVGCLFTSKRFGRNKDSPEAILEATGPAMSDLMGKIAEGVKGGGKVGEVRMCQINSGLFGVPWESSRDIIEGLEFEDEHVPKSIVAFSRE